MAILCMYEKACTSQQCIKPFLTIYCICSTRTLWTKEYSTVCAKDKANPCKINSEHKLACLLSQEKRSFGRKVVVKQQHMTARTMTQREIKRWQSGIIQLYCQVLAKEMHKAWQNVWLVVLTLLSFTEKMQFKQLGPSLASSHIFWCIKRSPNACLVT